MNRRTEGLTISQAIDGFVKYKVVEGLSERTLESYSDHLSRCQGRVGDASMPMSGSWAWKKQGAERQISAPVSSSGRSRTMPRRTRCWA